MERQAGYYSRLWLYILPPYITVYACLSSASSNWMSYMFVSFVHNRSISSWAFLPLSSLCHLFCYRFGDSIFFHSSQMTLSHNFFVLFFHFHTIVYYNYLLTARQVCVNIFNENIILHTIYWFLLKVSPLRKPSFLSFLMNNSGLELCVFNLLVFFLQRVAVLTAIT